MLFVVLHGSVNQSAEFIVPIKPSQSKSKSVERETLTKHGNPCVVQQEAVTLLESRSGDGSLPEEEAGEEADTAEEEAEAEEAARALLGLPSTATGKITVAC